MTPETTSHLPEERQCQHPELLFRDQFGPNFLNRDVPDVAVIVA